MLCGGLIAAAGMTLGARLAWAQTTETERSAAHEVVAKIDSLQARLKPADLAKRIASKKDPDRDRVLQNVEQLWNGGLLGASDWIGQHPEVGFQEFKAVDTLTRIARSRGFTVEEGTAGLKTAFVGSWDSPAGADGPTLGVILEYDALRGTQGAFHGDQHNAQGPVGLAAAFALQDYMKEKGLKGRVKVFGTPAEEVGPPTKTAMLEAGAFQGADILVRSHSSNATGYDRAGFGVCCLNINEVKYTFTGRPSHQLDSWNGRNALEGAVHFYMNVDGLRSTWRRETTVQGIIPEGGAAPNVVPDRAVVDYYIRYPDEVYLDHVDSMMANAARGAALATGTTVKIDNYGRYRDGITLGTLEELKHAYEVALGAPGIVAEAGRPSGYEETGYVSRAVPGVGVTVYSSSAAGHSYIKEQDALKPVGHTGFLFDAKVMAGILYTFLTDPQFRQTVQTEHQTLAGLLDQYIADLKKAYANELAPSAGR
jgi:amidohydrolase